MSTLTFFLISPTSDPSDFLLNRAVSAVHPGFLINITNIVVVQNYPRNIPFKVVSEKKNLISVSQMTMDMLHLS